MRGVDECLKWMINNPMMELHVNGSLLKRRYNDIESCFEWYDNVEGRWDTVSRYTLFGKYDWQPYDPNPSVDFIVAYEDCKVNNSDYTSGHSKMFNYCGAVYIEQKSSLDDNYKKDTIIHTNVELTKQWKKVV